MKYFLLPVSSIGTLAGIGIIIGSFAGTDSLFDEGKMAFGMVTLFVNCAVLVGTVALWSE